MTRAQQTFFRILQNWKVGETTKRILAWFGENSLCVNEPTTQSLTFWLRTFDNLNAPVKYLGIYLDSKLTWEPHVMSVVAKLNKGIYMICTVYRLKGKTLRM